MFAVVKHDQRPGAVRQRVGEHVDEFALGLFAHTGGPRDSGSDKIRVSDGCELDHPHASGMSRDSAAGYLDGQAGLAHAGGAGQGDQALVLEKRAESCEGFLPADEACQRVWQVGRGGAVEDERGVVPEDLTLELPQLWRRVQSELVAKQPPHPLVGAQRVRLPPRPVQGEHEKPPEPLAQGMGVGQLAELAGRLAMPAQGQVEFELLLDGRDPQFVKAGAFPPDFYRFPTTRRDGGAIATKGGTQ